MHDLDERTEALLEKPCLVIDGLPERVPEHSAGQYASLEETFHTAELFAAFTDILVKLNCYYDLHVNCRGEWMTNPSAAVLSAWMNEVFQTQGRILILTAPQEALLALNGDDNHMTVYGPDETLLGRIRKLAASKGLFVWEGR